MAKLYCVILTCLVLFVAPTEAADDPSEAFWRDIVATSPSSPTGYLSLPTPMSIPNAKGAAFGTYVVLTDKVVTTSQIAPTDGFYVQDRYAPAGILTLPPPSSAPRVERLFRAGDVVNVAGITATNGAEVCILANLVSATGQTTTVAPVGISNRFIGGGPFGKQPGVLDAVDPPRYSAGVNNVGLLVKTWGKVTFIESTAPGFFYLDDGSALRDGSLYTGVRVSPVAPGHSVGDMTAVVATVGASTTSTPLTHGDQPVAVRELRTRVVEGTGAPVSDLRADVTLPTEAEVTWQTDVDTSSVLDVRGIVRVFKGQRDSASYVQAICYVPEEHKFLSADLIDQDLADIRATNANAINLYGLQGDALLKADDRGCHSNLQMHLLAGCEPDLKIIARLEWYDRETFAFTCGNDSDATRIADHYAATFQMFRNTFPDRLLCYLINMPLDDLMVKSHLPFDFPLAAQQQNYAQFLCRKIKEAHPGAKVRAVLHYSVCDNIPAAPLMIPLDDPDRDPLDGVALVAYSGRCNSSPFASGMAVVSCGSAAGPGDGPSIAVDPANVVIGSDQMDYWLEKARRTNWPYHSPAGALAMDGVGFSDQLEHWSGIVSDRNTKIQAAQYLADYLSVSNPTDGFSYFMLYDKAEGTFGIVDHRRVEDAAPAKSHRVVLSDLWPGAAYRVRVVGDGQSQSASFETALECPGPERPWLIIETPGYGGVLLENPENCIVTWRSNLQTDDRISLFADVDDRGLDGTPVGEGVVQAGGGGSTTVNLAALRRGGYHIYGKAIVSDCSAPGSIVWDYSPGRAVIPQDPAIEAQRATAGIDIDGKLDEGDWANVDWKQFAAHSETGTIAKAKFLWNADFLYAAFDVTDANVEVDPQCSWDSDSVSVWLWGGAPIDVRTDLAAFARESRQGPCEGGSSKPLGKGETAAFLKGGATCATATGYTVEMSVPWSEVHVVPLVGTVISADLLSKDFATPCSPHTKWWDGDAEGWLGSAIVLANDFTAHSGANLPWINYGWDVGRNPWGGAPGGFSNNQTRLQEDLRFLADNEARLVRVFTFCDLRSGVNFDPSGNPLGFDQYALADFDALVSAAEANGLRLIPVLFDYTIADGVYFEQGAPVGERPDLISSPQKRAALRDLFRSLITRYGGRKAVYAYDIMNEPEYASAVTRTDLELFVQDFADMIHAEDSGARTTLGCRNRGDLQSWNTFPLDIHQYHHYDGMEGEHPFDYPASQLGLQKPVLVGECQPTTVTAKLNTASRNGYAGILFWSLNADYSFRDAASQYANWVRLR
ncbi:MAG: sugar-binding protein [Armatimonadota bacterium]|nr:sugar-binding protein [Armatimonadota bacterium]